MSYRMMVVLSLLAVLFVDDAMARAWRVEQDGSGDFTAIQPALDAMAPGDSVLIGPGRFLETHEVVVPGWTEDVYAAVWQDSISIIGSGVDVTIIGPEIRDKQFAPRPKGIFGTAGIDGCRIEGLTVENIREGIYWGGGGKIMNCALKGCYAAMGAMPNGKMVSIIDTVFQGNEDLGIAVWGPSPEFVVRDCEFSDIQLGISIVSIDSMLVDGCTFRNHVVSIQYDSTIGEIRNCVFEGGTNADVSLIGSHTQLNDCRFSSAYRAISANTWGYVRGRGNIIPAGEGERIRISGTQFYFNGNHIFRSNAPYIKLAAFVDPPIETLDLSGNYWGTTDADTISAWIWDGNDDPEINAVVEYEPFSLVPVKAERRSMGAVKSLFR